MLTYAIINSRDAHYFKNILLMNTSPAMVTVRGMAPLSQLHGEDPNSFTHSAVRAYQVLPGEETYAPSKACFKLYIKIHYANCHRLPHLKARIPLHQLSFIALPLGWGVSE